MVMFRDFAMRKAKSLQLTGTGENLDDGSVRVTAQGDENKLKELIQLLNEGPKFANVEDVSVKWRETSKKFDGFKIIY